MIRLQGKRYRVPQWIRTAEAVSVALLGAAFMWALAVLLIVGLGR